MKFLKLTGSLCFVIASLATIVADAQVKAFPEAEGYGAIATGGRGGAVYHVTSLGDSNVFGTLRYGLQTYAPGQPLTIVFDVGGYITLGSKLGVTRDNVTIAGQTAPGGGIGIKGHQVSVGADNVVIRHMRFRPGKSVGRVDSLSISSGHNVIFDHVSASFSYDENASANALDRGGVANLTMQNSSVAYGLEDHSAGSLIQDAVNLSYHHNLYAHNHTRNPKARVEGGGIEWIGNVVYDYNNGFIAGDSDTTDYFWKASVYGNTYVTGPGDTGRPIIKDGRSWNYGLYFGTNAYDNDGDAVHDPVDYTGNGVNGNGLSGVVSGSYTWSPVPYGDTSIFLEGSTQAAYERTLSQFGATPWNRDEVDSLLYNNVVNRQGALIDREGDIDTIPDAGEYALDDVVTGGGFGSLAPGAAPADADQDGMPDAWELARGLSPTSASDRNVVTPSGYTMLETYLNELGNPTAGTTTWAAASGTWNEAGKWTGGVGNVYDNVRVHGVGGASGLVNVDAASGPAGALRLAIGGNGGSSGETVTVTGQTLDVMDSLTIGDQNHGTLQINSGSVRAESVILGNSAAASGTLHLAGGTLATTRIATMPNTGGAPQWNWSGGAVLRPRRDLYFEPASDSQRPTMSINANVNLGAGGGVLNSAGHNVDFTGVISGPGSLTKQGDGILSLRSANTFTGELHVQQGGVQLISGGSVAAASKIQLEVDTSLEIGAGSGTFVLTNGQTLTGRGAVVGNLVAGSGSIVRPFGELTSVVRTVGVQAEDFALSSDWAVFDNAIHGTGAGGSYDGSGLLGEGIVMVSNQSLTAPATSGLISTTVDIPEAGAWYLYARVAEPSVSVIPGDPATQAGGNNSLWVSGHPRTLQTSTTTFDEVQTPDSAPDAAKWVKLSPTLPALAGVWTAINGGIDYDLTAGPKTFAIGGREAGTVIDGFVLSRANLDADQLDAALLGSTSIVQGETLTVEGNYSQGAGAKLAVEIDGPDSFNRLTVDGAAVLGGMLEVSLADDGPGGYQPQVGDTYELLSAGGGLSGTFADGITWPELSGNLGWDIHYDYGLDRVLVEVVAAPLGADFDGDGDVDAADLQQFQTSFGVNAAGDANGDGTTDGSDLLEWQRQFTEDLSAGSSGSSAVVPEPSALILGMLGVVSRLRRRR